MSETTELKVKLNRHQRRAQAKKKRLDDKAANRSSQLLAAYFRQLQLFLDNPGSTSKNAAELAFKHALKKLFKNKTKTQAEFDSLLKTSVRYAKDILKQKPAASQAESSQQ